MKVLQLHSAYRVRGGEESAARSEAEMLRGAGHEVYQYWADNHNTRAGVRGAMNAMWSTKHATAVRKLVDRERPDIVHIHNWWPELSPSVIWAASHARVPIIITLHNYRLVCANGLLFRNGRFCSDCQSTGIGASVLHRCYRDSAAATASIAGVLAAHARFGTWNKIGGAIVPSEFAARILRQSRALASVPVWVKPNPIDVEPLAALPVTQRCGAVYVGRMDRFKGVRELLETWESLGRPIPLSLAGTGPLEAELRAEFPAARWLGWLSTHELAFLLLESDFLVLPSLVSEVLPTAMLEAMHYGAVVATWSSGAAGSVLSSDTALLYEYRNWRGLVSGMATAGVRLDLDAIRLAAFHESRPLLDRDHNVAQLVRIYSTVLARSMGNV